MKTNTKLLENIVAIFVAIHSDSRFEAHENKSEIAYMDWLRWIGDAGETLTTVEPRDYAEAGLDWNDVINKTTDGFFANLDAKTAVKKALLNRGFDSMYKGSKRFDREQLIFVAEVMIAACIDTVEELLPQSQGDYFDRVRVEYTTQTTKESLAWNLSIFYAQLTNDGIGCGDVRDIVQEFESELDKLIKTRLDPAWPGFIDAKRHNIDTRKHAEIFVTACFADEPEDYLNVVP